MSLSHQCCHGVYQIVEFFCSFDRDGEKRKPYQHDGEAMELLLRCPYREQGAVHRDLWGECS